MEQLFFIGIIVLFSILEAVARKGRAGRQGGEEGPPVPEEPAQRRPLPRPRARPEPEAGSVPRSYDEDPSFDEVARGDEGRQRRPAPSWDAREVPEAREVQDTREVARPPAPGRSGSEGLIPAEVWDEIQRMARGELPEGPKREEPARPAPVPAPQRRAPQRPTPQRRVPQERPVPTRTRPSGKAGPTGRPGASTAQPRTGKALGRPAATQVAAASAQEGTADHPVHLAHGAFGTPPSRRAAIRVEGRPQEAPAAAIRKLLLADTDSLRQAVILQEVLGPPVGLREG